MIQSVMDCKSHHDLWICKQRLSSLLGKTYNLKYLKSIQDRILIKHFSIMKEEKDFTFFFQILNFIDKTEMSWYFYILAKCSFFNPPEDLYWAIKKAVKDNQYLNYYPNYNGAFFQFLRLSYSINSRKKISESCLKDILVTHKKEIAHNLYHLVDDERFSWEAISSILDSSSLHTHFIRKIFSSERFIDDKEKLSYTYNKHMKNIDSNNPHFFHVILLYPLLTYDSILHVFQKYPHIVLESIKRSNEVGNLLNAKMESFSSPQKSKLFLTLPEISNLKINVPSQLDVSIDLLDNDI